MNTPVVIWNELKKIICDILERVSPSIILNWMKSGQSYSTTLRIWKADSGINRFLS